MQLSRLWVRGRCAAILNLSRLAISLALKRFSIVRLSSSNGAQLTRGSGSMLEAQPAC